MRKCIGFIGIMLMSVSIFASHAKVTSYGFKLFLENQTREDMYVSCKILNRPVIPNYKPVVTINPSFPVNSRVTIHSNSSRDLGTIVVSNAPTDFKETPESALSVECDFLLGTTQRNGYALFTLRGVNEVFHPIEVSTTVSSDTMYILGSKTILANNIRGISLDLLTY